MIDFVGAAQRVAERAQVEELKGAALAVLQDIDAAEVVRKGRIARLRKALQAVGLDLPAPKGRG